MAIALIEGAGGLATGGIIRHMRQAGLTVVGVDSAPHSAALYLADFGQVIAPAAPAAYLDSVLDVCRRRGVTLAFPTVPSTLLEWSRQAGRFQAEGITVVVSPPETIAVCEDKWLLYQHLRDRGIPQPGTSCHGEFPLIKPRRGSAGTGVFLTDRPVDMTGRISQEFLEGEELSADVLCDLAGHILTLGVRQRLRVMAGAAVAGLSLEHPEIERLAGRICLALRFCGPVNLQFIQTRQVVFCTEINPRLGGGAALTLAGVTGNWFALLLARLQGRPAPAVGSRAGLLLTRHYAELATETGGPRPPDAEQPELARGAREVQTLSTSDPPYTSPELARGAREVHPEMSGQAGDGVQPELARGAREVHTFAEALQSPCLSCPTSPCCRFLILQRLTIEDILSADHARYLVNFPKIRLGLGRDGAWSVLYEQPCRFLDTASALCRIHGDPSQPSICRHYSPYRCWYKPRLSPGDAADYLLIDRPRLEFILSRLGFDDSGRIVDVPGWGELRSAFRDLPLESGPDRDAAPVGTEAEAAAGAAAAPSTAPVGGSPADPAAAFRYADLADPCRDCSAYCCRTVAFPCHKPDTMAGLDYLQFVLGFPGLELGISDKEWSLLVHTGCRHLRDGRCALFGRDTRPLKCAYYDDLRCGFKYRFGSPPPPDFVRIPLDRFPLLLSQFRFDRHHRAVASPATAALAEALREYCRLKTAAPAASEGAIISEATFP